MQITAQDVLVVIDVQNDFCPGGALAVADGDAVIDPIHRIAPRFEHIVLTQDWHPAGHSSFASSYAGKQPFEPVDLSYGTQTLWPEHCLQGSKGAELHPALGLPQAELILRKGYRTQIDSYSAFFENDRQTPTGLGGYLRERGLPASSWPDWPMTFASARRPSMRGGWACQLLFCAMPVGRLT